MTSGERARRRGRALAWAAGLCAVAAPGPSAAQAAVQVAVGARYTSSLVHDSIVTPLDVRPAVGPTLAVTVSTPLEREWTVDATADFAWATLERHGSSASADLGTLRTFALTVALRRPLAAGLAARFGVGALKYLPDRETGIFRQGSGSLIPLGTAGLRWDVPLGRGRGLAVEARYDLHRFITPALRSVGFTAPRPVHRLAVLVGVRALGRVP